ncbi:MAG: LacI family DNA-binding transcriptional regulator [Opitutaceae bacterium]|nr:LacI family DNA-binding transcriptional regulator [Opitutaceae bacterium]
MATPVRITLRDVARRAGCHFSTVSLALRGRPEIPVGTRARLKKIADELGYRPDPMLASLSSYRRDDRPARYRATLAWVTNFPTRSGWRNEEIYYEYYLGARERAQALGFRLQEFWLRDENMTAARATQILAARGIQGLIIAPQPTPSEVVTLEWSRFSAVVIGYSVASPTLHMVCPNQYRSMKLAMDRLMARNYRRIALVMLRASDERVDNNWLGGYLVMQQRLPAANRLEPLLLNAWDEELFATWLRRERPDAIVSKCVEALPALRRLGYRLPQDLGAAFLTRVKSSREISGIDERPFEVGTAAVDYLVSMQHRTERGVPDQPRRLLIEGKWVEGRTVRTAVA